MKTTPTPPRSRLAESRELAMPALASIASRGAFAAALSIAAIATSPSAHAVTLTRAPDLEVGAKTFAYVCSACHLGGYNAVRAEKTLQADVLRENGMMAADAIEYQVTNGKNNMPAFGGRLTDDEITNVAYYVIYQSQTGWNKQPIYTKYPSKYVPDQLMKAYRVKDEKAGNVPL